MGTLNPTHSLTHSLYTPQKCSVLLLTIFFVFIPPFQGNALSLETLPKEKFQHHRSITKITMTVIIREECVLKSWQ